MFLLERIQKPLRKRLIPFWARISVFATLVFWGYALLPVWGEPPRLEQEYKITLTGTLSETEKKSLYDMIAIDLPIQKWENSRYIPEGYYMGSDLDVLYFEDEYFDDASGSLARAGISHRLRYRWKSLDDALFYVERGAEPQRLEIQTKAYRLGPLADSDGYKKALKNRYEIKKDYRLNPITDFLLRRENGNRLTTLVSIPFLGRRFSPVAFVLDAAFERGLKDFRYSSLQPAVRLIVKRTRFHINKKTPFGYGDNPDNVFLVTIDEATIYSPTVSSKAVGTFSEIEIDFERNTFFKLFDSVYKAGNENNRAMLESFEADQKILKSIIVDRLSAMGHPPEDGAMLTKYSKALRSLEGH